MRYAGSSEVEHAVDNPMDAHACRFVGPPSLATFQPMGTVISEQGLRPTGFSRL